LLVDAAAGVRAVARRALHLRHHHGVRGVAGLAAAGLVEVGLPRGGHAGRVGQVLFVEVFDVAGVAAGQLGRAGELLDQAVHGRSLLPFVGLAAKEREL
jgi:hypothetical protein